MFAKKQNMFYNFTTIFWHFFLNFLAAKQLKLAVQCFQMNLSIATLHPNSKAFSREGKGGGVERFIFYKTSSGSSEKILFFAKN